jgi:hypothetical protein
VRAATSLTYSGLIAYWIDAAGMTWLGPVECAPWRLL